MNKHAKVGQPVKNEDPNLVSQAATPPETPEYTNPAVSAESEQKEKMPDFKAAIEAATAGKLLIRGQAANADLQKLVDKLLTEGSTFEDVGGVGPRMRRQRAHHQRRQELLSGKRKNPGVARALHG